MTTQVVSLTDEQKSNLPGWAKGGYEITTWGMVGDDVTAIRDSDADALDDMDENAIVLIQPGWWGSDSECRLHFPECAVKYSMEAAKEFITGGDWGEGGGEIKVSVWREGVIWDDTWSEWIEIDVFFETYTMDLPINHAHLIQVAAGKRGCGTDPDDHDWDEDERGGLGGTRMKFTSHCRKCGLHREQISVGAQHNPGEGDSVEYDMPKGQWCEECQEFDCSEHKGDSHDD